MHETCMMYGHIKITLFLGKTVSSPHYKCHKSEMMVADLPEANDMYYKFSLTLYSGEQSFSRCCW